jgi:hypothetical protein
VSSHDAELDVTSPALAGWLRAAGAAGVIVRPDRIVRSVRPTG